MTKQRVWKVTVAEKTSIAKDYWFIPARNIEEALRKARRETASNWDIENAQLIEGDWIAPAKSKSAVG